MKICVVGVVPQELKTAFIRKFAEGKFTTNYLPTLGVDITTKKIQVDNNKIKLILVDTTGQEFFGKLRPSYYRGASAIIILFDKGDKSSFYAVKSWCDEFRKHIPDQSVPISLVGFNTNVEEITTKKAIKLAKELEAEYYELKGDFKVRGNEIDKIFGDITRRALETKEKR